MAKEYNVDNILDEFEAKRRPSSDEIHREGVSRAKQPFKLKSFADTAELMPQRKLIENQTKDIAATRMDIPVAVGAAKHDLGRTQVIDLSLIEAANEKAADGAEEEAGLEPEQERRRRFRKFASVTAIPDDDDLADDEDDEEESFMGFSSMRKRKEKKAGKKAELGKHGPIDEEAAPVVSEYTSKGETKLIERDLVDLRIGIALRLVVSFFGFLALLYLACMSVLPGMTPGSEFVTQQPTIYMGINTGVLALLCLVSNKVVGGGVIAFFRLKSTNDTALAFAALCSLGLGVALAVNPEPVASGYSSFYFASVAAGFFFNALGKLFMVMRIAKNFELIQNEDVACLVPVDTSTGGHLGGLSVAMEVRTKMAGDFLAISYSDDLAESLSRITAPVFIGFSVVAATVSFLIWGDAMLSFASIAAMLAVASPFAATLCGSLPLYRACGRLAPSGGAICGHSALSVFEDTDAIIVDASELFPKEAVILHGIKSFAEGRIDSAIIDAASVMCATGGLLSEVFLKVVGGRRDILRKVTDVVYEDGRGTRANVAGELVFLGNRELMRAHGIAAPSKDYESKFVGDGKDIIYLAGEGGVTAMFVLGYHADDALSPHIKKLIARDMVLLVRTEDPNITQQRIASAYAISEDYVRIVPEKVAAMLPGRSSSATRPAYVLTGGNIKTTLRAIAAIHTVRATVISAASIQLIGLIIGYALVAFCSFVGAMSSIGIIQILVYQAFWALLTTLAACMGRA